MNYEADQLRKELRELQAEVERLREALEMVNAYMKRALQGEAEDG